MNQPVEQRTHFSAAELAAMTGKTEKTILRWSARGLLPSTRVGGSRLFPAAECLRILNGEPASANLVSLDERRTA